MTVIELKKIREKILDQKFHDEQIQIWAEELIADLGVYNHLNPDFDYDDNIHQHKVIEDKLKEIRRHLNGDL